MDRKMFCSKHPQREAAARCVKCGKYYCRQDLESIGRNYVCFGCLKGIAKKTLDKRSYKPLTMGILVAAGIFIALGVVSIASKFDFISGFFSSLIKYQAADYMGKNTSEFWATGAEMLKAGFFFLQAYLLSMNKTAALIIGIIASVVLLAQGIQNFAALDQFGLVFQIIIPVAILFLLLANRKELSGEAY